MNEETARTDRSERTAQTFATTHWTVVLSAREARVRPANEALTRLCRTYWPPLFAFLRGKG